MSEPTEEQRRRAECNCKTGRCDACLDSHVREAEARGRESERAEIVAWLRRKERATANFYAAEVMSEAIGKIDRGEHRKGGG